MPEPSFPRTAVIGAGAVGGYFGGLLARAGAPVTMIGRPAFVEAVQRKGLFLDTLTFKEHVRVEASTDLSAVRSAELILFSVKTTDNAATARGLAPFLSPGATVICLQNGVDNVEQLRAAAGIDALPAVVYLGGSVPEPGTIKHVGRGDLVMGPDGPRVNRLVEMFVPAGIPCRISDNIQGELWTKLIWNCSLNAISALGHAKYGTIAADAAARNLVGAAAAEVLAVAHAARITLPTVPDSKAAFAGAMQIATQMSDAFSSTAQDIQRGKRTEIDSLNGYISRRAAELGVPTPVNDALHTLVKLLENHTQPA